MRLLVPLLILATLALAPSAEAVTVAIPGNPMTVYVNDAGRITTKHVRDSANVFYSPLETDSPNAGFTLGLPNAIGTIPAGTTFGPAGSADFVPAAQGAVSGTGTEADPFQVVTSYLASDGSTTAAEITQTVRYVSGQTRFSVSYDVVNPSSISALPIRAGQYADLYLADDEGTGVFRPGPPRFVGGRSADARVGGIEEVLTSPWDRFEEDAYTSVRANLVNLAGPGLDNSVNPALVDNGVAVQWDRTLAPLGRASFATAWTFENIGRPTQLPPPPPPPPVDNSIDAQLARLPAPAIGKAVNVGPVKGEVYVKLAATKSSVGAAQAKGRGFVRLRAARQIPVGSLLDTRKGVVRLVSAADSRTRTQQADFNGGLFKTLQSRKGRGLTELRMSSGKFSGCRLRGKRSSLANSAQRRYRKRTVRRLRGNGSGRFRTRGRYSSATVRGTDWTVTDRCDGTLTRVKRGRVAVRDIRRKKTITLRAGKRYLAKAP